MHTRTKKIHDTSDRLVNLKLALVLTSRELYGEAISLFEPIYQLIEEILERQADHPQLGKLAPFLATMRRSPGFRADMKFYIPEKRHAAVQALRQQGEPKELQHYLDRLSQIEKEDPVRLLAYAFHMNMAIFAGGYIIKKMVRKAMGLPKDSSEGVMTFTFPPDLDTRKFQKEFKRVLNEEVVLSQEEVDSVLDESGRVFAANNALVATVQGTQAYSQAAVNALQLVFKGVVVVALSAAAISYGWKRWSARASLAKVG